MPHIFISLINISVATKIGTRQTLIIDSVLGIFIADFFIIELHYTKIKFPNLNSFADEIVIERLGYLHRNELAGADLFL